MTGKAAGTRAWNRQRKHGNVKSTYGGTKDFNGERFTYLSTHKKQRSAQEQAMHLRKRGFRTRTHISREDGGKPTYLIFGKLR